MTGTSGPTVNQTTQQRRESELDIRKARSKTPFSYVKACSRRKLGRLLELSLSKNRVPAWNSQVKKV